MSFRYVECDRDNSYTFSYEFGSILRDIGSIFGSVLDTLVRNSENRKLYTLIDSESRNGNRIRLFGEIGYIVPEETRKSLLFF